MSVTLEDVLEARRTIAPYIQPTPLEHSPVLSAAVGAQVYLKLESFQETRAFKIRGALNKLAHLSPEERARGVVAASGGNHAQGVAFAAARLGIKATVVLVERAPENLAAICRGYGAKVYVEGQVFEEALTLAQRLADLTDQVLIHAYDDRHVIAGQGTIGLEVLEALPEVEAIVVPVGGGGLLAGVALAAKSLKGSVQIIGVQPEEAPSLAQALEAGRPVPTSPGSTLASKLAVRQVGELPFVLARAYLDQLVLVSEAEIREAVCFLLDRVNLLVEGAAAVTWAALQSGKAALSGQRVVLIISGGNIGLEHLRSVLAER